MYIVMFFQVAVVGSVELPKADLWVMFAILSTVIGYIAKTYFTLSVLLVIITLSSPLCNWQLCLTQFLRKQIIYDFFFQICHSKEK